MILHKIDKITGKKVPTERLLFKFGPNKTTKGTFYLTEESAKEIVNSWKQYGNKLNIDYSHQQLSEIQTADGSISAGTYDLAIKTDGIYAVNIEWTTRAAKYITDKEYIYTSPAFITELRDGKEVIIEVINFALTNIPATLHMDELLIAASKLYKENKELTMTINKDEIKEEVEAVEDVEDIVELANEIVEDEVVEEKLAEGDIPTMTLEEAMAALKAKDALVKELEAKVEELKSKLGEAEDKSEEMEKLNQKLTKLSTDLDTKTKEVIVLTAIHSGKLNPAQKDLYISLDAAKLNDELEKLPTKSVMLNKTVDKVVVSEDKSEVRKLSDYINKRVFGR